MRRDPFLNRLFIILDRLSAWLWLVAVFGALLWSLVWQTGLGFSGQETFWQFIRFVTGNADRTGIVISLLILGNAALLVSLISIWLFNRWNRSGELQKQHLRGTRLENDQ